MVHHPRDRGYYRRELAGILLPGFPCPGAMGQRCLYSRTAEKGHLLGNCHVGAFAHILLHDTEILVSCLYILGSDAHLWEGKGKGAYKHARSNDPGTIRGKSAWRAHPA